MNVKKLTKNDTAYPTKLRDIPSPPEQLYYLGDTPGSWDARPKVAIVGSRAVTPYGKAVTAKLARELAEQGVVIISGLALGIDAISHQSALEVKGDCIAVLPSGLDEIYPATNRQLARSILEHGGTLLSEYKDAEPSYKGNFVARNRIVSGMADALLIIEAAEKSGTLHTANFALQQGRDVLVVPGNITSPNSVGTNNLIKAGAMPVTCTENILRVLHMQAGTTASFRHKSTDPAQQTLLDILYTGTTDGHELMVASGLDTGAYTTALTMLELEGKVHPLGNNHWSVN